MATSGPEANDDPRYRWQRLGAGLLGLQILALVGLALVQAFDLVTGRGDVVRNELMIIIMLLVAAGGLAVVAHGVLHGRAAIRTAGVFWQVLLLAIVWFQWQAGVRALALVVLVVAVASAVAVVMATRPVERG